MRSGQVTRNTSVADQEIRPEQAIQPVEQALNIPETAHGERHIVIPDPQAQGFELTQDEDAEQHFERIFSSCVYETPGLPRELPALRGQLDESHVADGFEAVVPDAAAHTLDPLELILRAYHLWEHGRWPGRTGRLSFARVCGK